MAVIGPTVAEWQPAYDRLLARLHYHDQIARRRLGHLKWQASLYHVAIPLLAVAVTIVIGSAIPHGQEIGFSIGGLLALLSTLNSTVDPARRYADKANAGIDIYEIRAHTQDGLVRLSNQGARLDQVLGFLEARDAELSEVGRRLAETRLPRAPLPPESKAPTLAG